MYQLTVNWGLNAVLFGELLYQLTVNWGLNAVLFGDLLYQLTVNWGLNAVLFGDLLYQLTVNWGLKTLEAAVPRSRGQVSTRPPSLSPPPGLAVASVPDL